MLAPWPANMQHAAVRAARLAAVPDSGADEGDTRASEIVRAILANHGILGIHRLHRAMERLEMDRGRTSAAVPDEKSLYFLIEHMLPSTALLASFGADVPAFHRAVRAGTPRAGLADLLVRSAPPGELLAKLRDWSPRAFAELEGRVKYRSPEGKGTKVPEASLRTRLRQK
jgi:hypothetical protein